MSKTSQFSDSIAEITISYSHQVKASDRISISSSRQAFEVASSKYRDPAYVETFGVLMLNRANKVLGFVVISRGGISGTVVDPKVVFQAALKANASSIILVHNHPSGNVMPSIPDTNLTNKLVSAGRLLDIAVFDHIIIGAIPADGYFSFADEGMIKNNLHS